VVIAAGWTGACARLSGGTAFQVSEQVNLVTGNRMRLYLFDAPEGSSIRILAIAIVVPESRFERAVEGAPALSVEFHAP